MKMKSIAIAIIASAIFSVSAIAAPQKECKAPAECKKEVCLKDKPCSHDVTCKAPKKDKCTAGKCEQLLEGITLTPEQQKKVDAFKADCKKQAEKMKQEAAKAREKAAKERSKKQEKLDKEMKKILTPEQYAQFQANQQKAQAAKAGKGDCKKGGKGDCKKGGKDGRKGHGKHDGKQGKKGGEGAPKACCAGAPAQK